jgi:predicted permease
MGWLRRLRGTVSGSGHDEVTREEMRFHLDQLTEAGMRRGLSSDRARQEALLRFGSVALAHERTRDADTLRWLKDFVQDVRYTIRSLGKTPGFALVAIATLALGIGANTAIFSVVSGVLLKPLPYANGGQLVLVRQSARLAGRPDAGVSIRELYDYREQTSAFDNLVEYHQMSFDLLKRGEPDRVSTGVVSHNFFDVLGITPILGRTFVEGDDRPGADAVLVLSYSYWQQKFGGDRSIVGQVFQMNDRPHTVVGVLPNVPHYPQENDVYMSVSACPFRAAAEKQIASNRRAFPALTVFGHLKPGITRERAAGEVDVICGAFVRANTQAYRPGSGFAATTLGVQEEMTRNARPMLLVLLGTTGLILLIACANVANLTLARLLRRDRELALRTALGASRARLVRQLLTESTILALAGGVLGVLLAMSAVGMLTTFVGRFTARTSEIGIDPWVLAFTLAVSIATGLLFGTFPALASRVDLVHAMKQGTKGGGEGRGRRRLQNALIVGQVAVSVVLLVGAGLLLTSFYRLQRVDAGYRADRVLSAELFTNFTRYPNRATQLAFYQPLIQRLQGGAGIVSVAVTNAVPLSSVSPQALPVQIEGRMTDDSARRPTADLRIASPNFFATIGVPIAAGRVFTDADSEDAPRVMVINKAMTRLWEGDNPIGSRLSLDNGRSWATVVGVVGNVRQFGLDKDAVAQVYAPLGQNGIGNGMVLVRTVGEPVNTASIVRDSVHAIDPDMPVENVRTLDDIRRGYLATPLVTALLLAMFAALAMLVTLAGVTGVIATSVSQRTPEFGVRLALGARPQQVLLMVIAQGLTLVVAGLVIGAAASIALTRVLSTFLFETTPTDPATFGVVALVFLLAGTAACLGPAWRATRADPMSALRAD